MSEAVAQQILADTRKLEIEIRLAVGILRSNVEDLCQAIKDGTYFGPAPEPSGS